MRRFYPGLDPMSLTLAEFELYATAIGEVAAGEAGSEDRHMANVERRAWMRERGIEA